MRLLALLFLALAIRAQPIQIEIDHTKILSPVRPLHGVNKGPVTFGGLIDLTKEFRAAGFPHIRLHDCQWPYPDVVDIHAIFRDPKADPKNPANYDFALTDEYINQTLATGAQIIYRLGESIEHAPTKRFVHPPADAHHWTEICRAIIRRYHKIQYWEIWNEPENRPAMWTGNDEQFFHLYTTAARGLKRDFPTRKFGGPSLGHTGDWKNNTFTPSEFLLRFLKLCQTEKLPLDFFSWHCYTDDPHELTGRAKALRKLLDAHNFTSAEMHLNEWNYLPQKSWQGVSNTATPAERQQFEKEMTGPQAAAFATATLIELQDSPITIANYFHAEIGLFGLFTQHAAPTPVYEAFKTFNQFVGQTRLTAKSPSPQVSILATKSKTLIAIRDQTQVSHHNQTLQGPGVFIIPE